MRVVIASVVMGLSFLTGAAHAADNNDASQFRVYGPGAESCGAWQQESGGGVVTLSWLLGFVSGVGSVTPLHLAQTDKDGIEVVARTYCAQHPLNSVEQAAHFVVQSMINSAQ